MHHQIAQEGVEKGDWDPSVDRFGALLDLVNKEADPFEAYLAIQDKNTIPGYGVSHVGLYRQQWEAWKAKQ